MELRGEVERGIGDARVLPIQQTAEPAGRHEHVAEPRVPVTDDTLTPRKDVLAPRPALTQGPEPRGRQPLSKPLDRFAVETHDLGSKIEIKESAGRELGCGDVMEGGKRSGDVHDQ
jgi:hypothetical protein